MRAGAAGLRHLVLAAVAAGLAAAALASPPIPQDPAYHALADGRAVLGVPNGLNVLSNLLFGLVGWLGLRVTFDRRVRFLDPWERWPWAGLFAASVLTMAGSAYYHLDPDSARLVWDRLPIALGFMAFLTAVLAERLGVRLARALFRPLLLLGAAGVLWWHWTELAGRGDLRAYGLVQFGSLVLIVSMLLLYPPRYSGTGYLLGSLGLYGLALLFQWADAAIFVRGEVISGHTLKHVSAAGGIACLAVMLRRRRPVPGKAPLRPDG